MANETKPVKLPKALAKAAENALELARATVVVDQATADEAGDILVAVAGAKKGVLDVVDPMVAAAHQAHKKMTTMRKQMVAPLDEAEKHLRKQLADWARQVEEERLRLEREAAAAAEAALEEARKDEAMAEATGEAPPQLAIEPVADEPPAPAVATKGVGFAKRKTIKVVDPKAAIEWAVPQGHWNLVVLDTAAVRKFVNLVGDAIAVPGVVVGEEYTTRVGG